MTTMEGMQEEAAEFGAFLANEGAEQCGYCSPGFIMNVIAMSKELENPGLDEIKEYLSGNLCRCRGIWTASCDSEILKDEEGGEVDEVCKCTNYEKKMRWLL